MMMMMMMVVMIIMINTLNLRVEKVVNLPPFSSSCSELVNT